MRITWLLRDELAVGTAPSSAEDLNWLEGLGVCSVVSLSAVEEAPPPGGMAERFHCVRLPLPDHRHGCPPSIEQLGEVLVQLTMLCPQGPVFLHCFAAVERAPLVAMAWLIHSRNMGWGDALDYVQQTHPGTSPLPDQLAVLRSVEFLSSAFIRQIPVVG
ncbi:dual specificity protein phosphatase family protein [Synechococcus sp. J7-Johnson]|uniref:protein-tyrosine phosphatase family protein n=1 Tax=Synechococcus sp. J7-Johnson TaxID=2823737 RepID=UPI0020CD59CC|nr:dual specificity protein phosphatase [Synechococcus sp. J7-Johnson]MCP9841764.1 dual specificity protein phosphatase family protein [Synechococcus sp. J7-Johnson]